MYVYMCQGSVISSVLSHLNKNLKQQTSKSLACHSSQTDRVIALGSQTDHVIALGQIGVTALSYSQFYLENNRKIHPREGMSTQKTQREERASALWLLFLYVLFLPPGPALCKLG